MHESTICLFPLPSCMAYPGALSYCTMSGQYTTPPSNSRVYAMHHTILVVTISCKGQLGVSPMDPSCRLAGASFVGVLNSLPAVKFGAMYSQCGPSKSIVIVSAARFCVCGSSWEVTCEYFVVVRACGVWGRDGEEKDADTVVGACVWGALAIGVPRAGLLTRKTYTYTAIFLSLSLYIILYIYIYVYI